MQYCFKQHQSFTTRNIHNWALFFPWLCSSFFLELFLLSSSVACWTPINLGNSSFSVLSFYFFILYMGFSRQEYWSGLLFPSSLNHILSPPWPILLRWPYMTWSIISLCYTKLWSMWSFWLVFCTCGFHCVCPLMDEKRLWKLPDGRDWLWGKLDLALGKRAMLSKSLIQFSADGWGCILSL